METVEIIRFLGSVGAELVLRLQPQAPSAPKHSHDQRKVYYFHGHMNNLEGRGAFPPLEASPVPWGRRAPFEDDLPAAEDDLEAVLPGGARRPARPKGAGREPCRPEHCLYSWAIAKIFLLHGDPPRPS